MLFLFSSFFFFFFLLFFVLGIYSWGGHSYFFDFFFFYNYYLDFSFIFLFDYVSFFFFSFVSLISSMVFIYSKFYMSDIFGYTLVDNSRFFYILFLFVVSMFFLVFSGSWLIVLFGWDGLGLVSFLLVIYFNNASSLDSGLLTVFTNRVGDGFFILSFMFMYYGGWFSYDFLVDLSSLFIVFILSMGCFTKSAQIPFSSWLPAAMAAPTPVSSLVHSSTLVTAGVYLFIRFNYLFSSFFSFISLFSLITMFMAGFFALYDKDFKKIIAMSTLSQLGFMIFSVSIGYWLLSFLHMVFHALFKSSLFLSVGGLMHNLSGDQDSRYFGSLGSSFFSKVFFTSSCISLVGFPFSLGFYSKDLFICLSFSSYSGFYYLLFLFSCFFTVAYSFRLIFGGFSFFPSFYSSLSFSEVFFFFFPIIILYFMCIFFGNFFFCFFILPFSYSFLDSFLGVFILLVGFLLYSNLINLFLFDSITGSVGFMHFFSSPLVSSIYLNFSFVFDITWSEFLGGMGALDFFSFLYSKGLYVFSLMLFISVFFFFLF